MKTVSPLLMMLVLLLGGTGQAQQPGTGDVVAIIGTGQVGSTLGPRLFSAGYRIVYGSRSPDSEKVAELLGQTGSGAQAMTARQAAAQADIIVLAIPWSAVEELLLSFDDVSGKIIVDCINAVRFRRRQISLVTPSMAQTIARLAPGAHVVKALNTTTAANMANPQHGDSTISMPIAGDDSAAKHTVTDMLKALGFHVVDVGPLSNAPYLEAMGALYIHMNAIQGRRGNFEYRILDGASR